MTFTYVASGGLHLNKCGFTWELVYYYIHPTPFSVGDEVWLKYKAIVGILESVVIKKIKLTTYLYKGKGSSIALFIDTFNRVYNENDIINNQDAVNLANNYIQQELKNASKACVL